MKILSMDAVYIVDALECHQPLSDEPIACPAILKVLLLVSLLLLTATGYSQTIPSGAATLWNASASPATSDEGPDSSVELGVQFTSSVPGQVLGVRFYKSGSNTGTHTAHLWASSGVSLATATFSGETKSGWQQVLFSSPVNVSANTNYVISYHCPNGHYADDQNYFSKAYSSSPLQVPINGGVFAYGYAPIFPKSSWLASNYWVDVVFLPTTTAVSISPTSVSLAAGATQQFTASVTGTTNTAVTWSATGGTVTSSGLYTAPGTAGTYQVTATSQANTSVSATAAVTVTIPSVVAVSISPTTASLVGGGTQQFTASVTGASNTAVTWTATGGTVSSGGLYTAGSTTGTFNITATSQADSTKSASAVVTIGSPTTTTVNFDSPTCPSSNLSTYGGINWSGYPWACESAGYANDSTTVVSWSQQITSAEFSFVSPSILASLSAGGGSTGIVTLSTDAGETTNLSITAAKSMTSYQTGFSKPATVVTVSYGNTGLVGWTIALDNLMYSTNGANGSVAWSISGTVSPAANGSNTSLTLSGTASAATTADTSGNYVFTNLANGTYAVTPVKSGFTFSPTAANALVNGANVTGVNFTATTSPTSYTLSGSISPANLAVGTTVALSGTSSASTTVNSNGGFTFSGLANGTYIVTPSMSGLTYSPTSSPVTINGGNVSGVNFTVTPSSTYSISGSVLPAVGGAGATVTLSGAANATTTVNGSGIYSFSGLPAGSYTVTASSNVATFNPASQTAIISNSSLTGVSFSAATTANIFFFDNFPGTTLGPDWTVISRHGEYAQSETECNIPQQVVTDNSLSILVAAQSWGCGDFNTDGSVRHTPSNWPYITGDVQWKSLNFTYGTVEIRGKFPAKGAGIWPAFWLLGSNCQGTNPYTADVGYSTCPTLSSPGYAEVDMVECFPNTWCQLSLSNTNGFATCSYSVDTNYHIFTLTWNAAKVSVAIDGKYTGCSFTSGSKTIPSTPMFLIMQIQTGGLGGTPNNALLPAALAIDYVRVTQP